ncbi:MAG: UDP-N-acetylmuramate--L-alanine ligase [Bacteroidetes bacterium]|nr:UDP-N-acetylmuramate--L-alanine ligase [Bacteroidota bacterium]
MKPLKEIKKIYFLGIGGIGMSALARYFKTMGAEVSGYDKTQTALTDELVKEGIAIIFHDEVAQMPKDVDLVVYTPAIPKDHKGFNFYKDNHYEILKRSEVLGIISADRFTIAVAGSHGKTTVSSMIAHILKESGFDCSAFLGGIAVNYNTNFLQGINDVVVIEADEFDRSFHRLCPDMAVVTAVDTDHLDIYGSKEAIDEAFIEFTNKITEEGFLVIRNGESINDRLPILDKAFYSLHDREADVYCTDYQIADGGYLFNINYYGLMLEGFRLNIGGFHNIENAIAAITVAKELKITDELIKKSLASFKGIRRRFEKVYEDERITFIDDYAHHPEEIRVFLQSIKELYPGRKLTAVFQPHLFSRTKDLATDFAKQLSIADEVILLDIYPAREQPMEGVTSELIFKQLNCAQKQMIRKEELVETIRHKKDLEILVTIGAGDIDKYLLGIKAAISR